MKRKAQIRHKAEEIEKAVTRIQNGESLSLVAKELGISKSLASYWVDNCERLVPANPAVTPVQGQSVRMRRFIEQCATTISLAFKRLKTELKSDSPRAVKDLGLLIAVLHDKQTQASQKLETQAPRNDQDWSASEDTLLILKRHRGGDPAIPPEKNIVEAGVEPSGLEQQNSAALPAPEAGQSPQKSSETPSDSGKKVT